MITRADIIKDLHDWKNGNMGLNALMDAIDRYSSASNNGKPLVGGSLPHLTDYKMAELKKIAEKYCYLTHDDKPTISQKGLELVIIEALRQ